tara:strand:- start:38 stop:232 length:195 start_codon:yes stop_codon:yes gene_type:complete
MPIWLRNLTFKKIQEFYEKESKTRAGNPEKSWVDPKMKNQAKREKKTVSPPSFVRPQQSKTSYK